MKATEFEFRYRFWLIGAIFWFGFLLYKMDPLNMAQYLVNDTVRRNIRRTRTWWRGRCCFSALFWCFLPR